MSLFYQKGQVAIPQLASETEADGSTQTDIVAVHTPQMETGLGMPFPYQRASPSTRPSSLPISQCNPPSAPRNPSAALEPDAPQELQHFATSLVDGVLRTVAEQGGETETDPIKGNGTPSDQGEVNVSVKENGDDDGGCKDTTDDGCITVLENGQDGCEINEGMGNRNYASEEGSRKISADAADSKESGISHDENNMCVMISTEPPSTPSSPFQQLDSPNNNQHPIKGNVIH
jgi:hypothetical protein